MDPKRNPNERNRTQNNLEATKGFTHKGLSGVSVSILYCPRPHKSSQLNTTYLLVDPISPCHFILDERHTRHEGSSFLSSPKTMPFEIIWDIFLRSFATDISVGLNGVVGLSYENERVPIYRDVQRRCPRSQAAHVCQAHFRRRTLTTQIYFILIKMDLLMVSILLFLFYKFSSDIIICEIFHFPLLLRPRCLCIL